MHDRDLAWLSGVLEMPVAALCPHMLPTIFHEQPDQLSTIQQCVIIHTGTDVNQPRECFLSAFAGAGQVEVEDALLDGQESPRPVLSRGTRRDERRGCSSCSPASEPARSGRSFSVRTRATRRADEKVGALLEEAPHDELISVIGADHGTVSLFSDNV